jgi:large subunit ribosomal protein L18
MALSKSERRNRIHFRIRKTINGTANAPRLSVFRSNKEIYAQLIDDVNGVTIASASSREEGVQASGKIETAQQVGKLLAERGQKAGIETVRFDRSGYLYHGRIKALADGARESGLKF